MIEENQVYKMEAIEFLSQIDDGIVDMILCDLPYGTTNNDWDLVIPLEELWKQYKRILKDNGVVVLTASQPFTTDLINSNRAWFKYSWVWNKKLAGNGILAKYQPLKIHEDILVFSKGSKYFPIKRKGIYRAKGGIKDLHGTFSGAESEITYNDEYYPESIIEFSGAGLRLRRTHPTEKPVSLFRYLIKTYTQEGELVVDNCVGSGTTAVACKQANRRYLCCDINPDYVRITKERLNQKTVSEFYPYQECIIEIKRESSADSPNPKSKILDFA